MLPESAAGFSEWSLPLERPGDEGSPDWSGPPGLGGITFWNMGEATVATQVQSARNLYERVKGRKLSEADTKAFFIEPLLRALGWPMDDPNLIHREYAVYDGSRLDYALFDQGVERPAIFVEAKALRKTLDDPGFISQTVNYANNEGVRWCVLSNGTQYRIYRTVEPVPMERKMLLEVNLLDEDQEPRDLARSLGVLSQEFVCAGRLEERGQQVFTDVKVREALASLYADPSPAFVNAIRKALPENHDIGRSALVGSLRRLGAHLGATRAAIRKDQDGRKPGDMPTSGEAREVAQRRRGEWTLEHHLGGKPTQVVDLYERLHEQVMSLGDDINRTFAKFYINYSMRKSFTTVEIGRSVIKVFISVPPEEVQGIDQALFRDVRNIGHYGMGDVEARYSDASQLREILPVIRIAYHRRR